MKKTKILIVDDRGENLLALSNLLSSEDVEIITAASGMDALALLLEHEIALALLDVQMPQMNGFELARLMRAGSRSRHVPIIFVTASQGTSEQIFEGYEHGAVDYLLKPLDPHVVRSKVRVFLELEQKTKALAQKSLDLAAKLQEVEALKDAAETANQAKSRFLANMSHEIRTPLGAVLGYADLLRDQSATPEEREVSLAALTRNGQLLLRLIDDVLDLAKVEAERLDVDLQPVAMSELLADVRAVHAHRAEQKGITLKLVPKGLLPKTVITDALRLKQILNNIVGNAIKFTARGGVEVQISYDPQKKAGLRFEVKDSGIGLSAEQAVRLFTPFMQADSSTRRKFGGTGLGLVISRQLAQLLGGDVVLSQSGTGAGSTFVIAVNAGKEAPKTLVAGTELLTSPLGAGSTESIAITLGGLKVLVADDAPDNRLLISRMLRFAGAQVETAEDGSEAIEKALKGRFDMILMDLQMPGTDGYEATEKLRRLGFDKPIIALTAHAMKDELERCLEAGCDEHLSKPVNRRILLETLARQRDRSAS